MRKAALCLLVLLSAACVKPNGRNSVWLVIKNETGANLTSVSLEHGKKAAFKYRLFTAGYTFGGWARVTESQPLRLTYRNAAGDHQAPPLGKSLTPDMIGGVYTITLGPDGKIEQNFTPRTGPPPGGLARLEDYVPWIAGLVALLSIPVLVLFARRAWSAAQSLPSAVAGVFIDPVHAQAEKRFGLKYKECPVRMFTMDPDRPKSWWEGVYEGRMLGFLDLDRIWLGAPDEATLVAFGRKEPGASLAGRSFIENPNHAVMSDPAINALLARLSPAVDSVGILSVAVEASVTWKRLTLDALVADVAVLSALMTRVEELDPPLVRAVMRGDEATALALIRSGAALDELTIGYMSALNAAATAGRTELVRALLAAGAKTEARYSFPLHAAAYGGHAETVKVLLDAGMPVNSLDAPHNTPLIMAAQKGHEEVVALLLSRGADPNARNTDKGSALGYAKYGKFKRIVELLETAGAH